VFATGRHARTDSPRPVVTPWQVEPFAQRPGFVGQFVAQNMSPSNWAHTPVPHSSSSRQGVHAAVCAP
jgi:hypothetical protein